MILSSFFRWLFRFNQPVGRFYHPPSPDQYQRKSDHLKHVSPRRVIVNFVLTEVLDLIRARYYGYDPGSNRQNHQFDGDTSL